MLSFLFIKAAVLANAAPAADILPRHWTAISLALLFVLSTWTKVKSQPWKTKILVQQFHTGPKDLFSSSLPKSCQKENIDSDCCFYSRAQLCQHFFSLTSPETISPVCSMEMIYSPKGIRTYLPLKGTKPSPNECRNELLMLNCCTSYQFLMSSLDYGKVSQFQSEGIMSVWEFLQAFPELEISPN